MPYILGGLIAWSRRPDSRLGPLMIAAGFAMFVSSLQWASAALPYTIGLVFDLLPAALFIHVFLAFPSGAPRAPHGARCHRPGYAVAAGLQLLKMMLGGVGSRQPAGGRRRNRAAANTVQDVQLVMLSALALTGVALLVARRRRRAARCDARSRCWSTASRSGS